MKITLVCSGGKNAGVESIATFLHKQGHEILLILDPMLFYGSQSNFLRQLFNYTPNLIKEIVEFKPDLVGISVLSDTYGWALKVAESVKEKINTPIIFGGIHATSVPEVIIKEKSVDYVCVGEGEEAILDLVECLEQQKETTHIQNIWTKKNEKIIANPVRPVLTQLDKLPLAVKDKTIYQQVDDFRTFKGYYSVFTSRGCPFRCSFCVNSLLAKVYDGKGPFVRRRSVDHVIDELKYAINHYKIKVISIEDDVFTFDDSWLEKFCESYKQEIGLPFICQVHPQYLPEKTVALLKLAGCFAVGFGLQSWDTELKKKYLTRKETTQEILTAVRLLQEKHLALFTYVLLNLPKQDEEELIHIADFLNQHKPEIILAFWLRYYPRTSVVEIARKENILSEQDIKKIEENKAFIPFVINSRIFYKKEASNLICLLLISANLPRKLFQWIIKKRLYQYKIPLLNVFCHIYNIVAYTAKQLFNYKKMTNFPTFIFVELKFYGIFLIKCLKHRIRHKRRF